MLEYRDDAAWEVRRWEHNYNRLSDDHRHADDRHLLGACCSVSEGEPARMTVHACASGSQAAVAGPGGQAQGRQAVHRRERPVLQVRQPQLPFSCRRSMLLWLSRSTCVLRPRTCPSPRQMVRAFVSTGELGDSQVVSKAMRVVQQRQAERVRVSPMDTDKCRCAFLPAPAGKRLPSTPAWPQQPVPPVPQCNRAVACAQVRAEEHGQGLGRGGCRGEGAVVRQDPGRAAGPLPGAPLLSVVPPLLACMPGKQAAV